MKYTVTPENVATIQPAVWQSVRRGLEAGPVVVVLTRPKRTLDQNAKLWAMLTDVSQQVDWYGQHLSKEDWKAMFTASLQQQRTVPGIDGGFVVLGTPTSSMTKRQMSDLLELIAAFGAERGVRFHDQVREEPP